TRAGPEPVLEAAAGNTERRHTSTDRRSGQAIVFPRRAVVLIPEAEVEREIRMDFPIVLEEGGPLVLTDIRTTTLRGAKIFVLVQPIGALQKIKLIDGTDRSREEPQEVLHPRVVACQQALKTVAKGWER